MTTDGLRDWLLLIPTVKERDRLLSAPRLERTLAELDVQVETCGFGPIAAAAKAARCLAQAQYRRVLLAGIAGSYGNCQPVGSACLFAQVSCWGVGAGSGKAFQLAPQIGFSQLSEIPPEPADRDILNLETPLCQQARGLLLTCCAAAQSEEDCQRRLGFFPEAVAEDMEGFGVAVACQAAGVPLVIIRGISNRAGDRQVNSWAIEPALHSVAELIVNVFQSNWQGTR